MNKAQKAIIIAYEKGYRVLEDGVFISPKGVPLKTKLIRGKYECYSLKIGDNAIANLMIHRLCAYQKFGDLLFKADCVRHLDGNSLNNSWNNIAIGTIKDNVHDIPKKKRIWIGENASKYTIKWDREKIEEYYNKTHSCKETMNYFGISKSSLWRVLHRKTYNKNPNSHKNSNDII